MKTLNLFLAVIFSITTFNLSAQTKKETVKVYGNCGMCKSRIEKAALAAGATTAKWNDENQMLSVAFAASKTSLPKIEEAIAAVGHDTQNATASDEVYNKLHGCCQYERKATTSNEVAACCKAHANCTADCKASTEKKDCCKANNPNGTCATGKSCCAK